MLRKIALACALSSTLLMSACAVDGAASGHSGHTALDLAGRSYVWTDAPKKALVTPSIHFGNDQRVNGLAGCNNFMGGYRVEGDKLVFTQAATTMKMCDKDSMFVEQAWLRILGETAAARQDEKSLTLLDKEGQTLAVLEAQAK